LAKKERETMGAKNLPSVVAWFLVRRGSLYTHCSIDENTNEEKNKM